jgi:dipeptidyl aminopeptidase/acylaminoacyl peptidase
MSSQVFKVRRYCRLLLYLVPFFLTGAGAAPLAPESLLEWQYVADPQYAPDSGSLVWVQVTTDAKRNRYESELWIKARRADPRRLTSAPGRNYAPRWSPDGSRLAFLSDRAGTVQIFVMPMSGGEPRQVSDLAGGVREYAWSPDSSAIVATSTGVAAQPEDAGQDVAFVTRAARTRSDGTPGWRTADRAQLWLIPVLEDTTRSVRKLSELPFDAAAPRFTTDGQSVVFGGPADAARPSAMADTDLYRLRLSPGSVAQKLIAKAGPEAEPLPSPDGRWIAFTGFDVADGERPSYRPAELYVLDLETGQWLNLTVAWAPGVADAMAGDVNAPVAQGPRVQWSADSGSLYFTSSIKGRVQLVSVDIESRRVAPVTSADEGDIGAFSVSPTGDVAAVFSRPDVPAQIVGFRAGRAQRGAWRQITDVNAALIARTDFAGYEEFEIPSFDDTRIQGWLVRPPFFDRGRRYPLILYIHGGPHAMYGTNFFHEFQVLAGAGYCVLIVNPRGSTGYGEAFGNSIQYAYPGDDYRDLMAAVDWAVELPFVDADRLGIAGGSGGGLLTLWTIGQTDRFRAASAHRSVSNWLSFAGTSDLNRFFVEHWFRGTPWQSPAEYLERSPLRHAATINTPVQIIHSEDDYRTPLEQSLQIYTALRLLDKTAELVVFPGASHGLSRTGPPGHRVERLRHIVRWFDQYLSPQVPGGAR